MICKKCGTQNTIDSIFCKSCGRKLKAPGRGFASLSKEKRVEIARRAGIIAHKLGRAHKYTHEEAIAAGRKGGKVKKLQ